MSQASIRHADKAEAGDNQVDDLLAQMADDEISQMLEKAESSSATAKPATRKTDNPFEAFDQEQIQAMSYKTSGFEQPIKTSKVLDGNITVDAIDGLTPEISLKQAAVPDQSKVQDQADEKTVEALPDAAELAGQSIAKVDEELAQIIGLADELDEAQAGIQTEDAIEQTLQPDTEIDAIIDEPVAADESPEEESPAPLEPLAEPEALSVEPTSVEPTSTQEAHDAIDASLESLLSEDSPAEVPVAQTIAEPVTEPLHSSAAEVARELALDKALTDNPPPQPRTQTKSFDFVGLLQLPARLLATVNRPVNQAGEPTRDFVGAIAIITLVNALAIMLYVMIFR